MGTRNAIFNKASLPTADGKSCGGIIGVITDITEHKRTERLLALEIKLARQLAVTTNLDDALQSGLHAALEAADLDTGAIYLREEDDFRMTLPCGEAELLDRLPESFSDTDTVRQHLMDRKGFSVCLTVPIATGSEMLGVLFILSTHSQTISESAEAILHMIAALIGGVIRRIEQVSEKLALEEQLRHATKMEAIGRLAGGVAHDFNNLLTVIIGQCELLNIMHNEDMETVQRRLSDIYETGKRAAALTQQLLAFSRKQVMKPEVINPNSLIQGFEKMLSRIIGEDIHFQVKLAPETSPVCADPIQIEQVIMNLCVNARDAMPDGGALLLTTGNVILTTEDADKHHEAKPGSYVCIRVTDNGCGMDAETQSKIFEPFFTTKESGKGTGLGLATVFGIVSQSNGHITVSSEVGMGTTVNVFLPSHHAAVIDKENDQHQIEQGPEMILVVEDEAGVRDFVHQALSLCGYKNLGSFQARLEKKGLPPASSQKNIRIRPSGSGRIVTFIGRHL